MAIDYLSSNASRYHDVADSDDFNLPNGDWTWLVVFNSYVNSGFPYFVSHGGNYGVANTVHLFNNGTSGFTCKVATLSDRSWGGGVLTTGKWMIGYGTRRNGNLYAGAGYIGEPGSVSESAGVAISSAYAPATAVRIGLRSDLTNSATYAAKTIISDAIYIPGCGFSVEALRRLLSGGLSELPDESWWNDRLLHAWLRSAQDDKFADLTGRHTITRFGTGYGSNESELFSIGRETKRERSRIVLPLFATGAGADLAGSATVDATSAGEITTAIPIVGAATVIATATAVISTTIDLSGVAASIVLATGDLDTGSNLAGNALSEASASAEITATIVLEGDAIIEALANAGIDTGILLESLASGQVTATGDLSGAAALQGSAPNEVSSTGQLTTQVQLIADAAGDVTASGDLASDAPALQAEAQSTADSNATLTTQIRLSGDAITQALASASLDAGALLSGDAVAEGLAVGDLLTMIPLAGDVSVVATGAGDLASGISLDGGAVSQAYASGDLYISLALSGDAAAYALAGATLTTQIQLSSDALAHALASGFLDGAVRSVPQSPKYTVKARTRDYRVAA